MNGAPFYVMELVDGVIYRDGRRRSAELAPDEARRVSEELVDVLAAIHARRLRGGRARRLRPSRRVPRAPGPALGRAVGAVEDRGPPRDRRARAPAARRAARVGPADDRARRLPPRQHDAGDRRPGRIVAVLDWEMSTLGDPLADLGLFLLYWGQCRSADDRHRQGDRPAGGLPQPRRDRRALRQGERAAGRRSSTATSSSRPTSSPSSSRGSRRGTAWARRSARASSAWARWSRASSTRRSSSANRSSIPALRGPTAALPRP